MADLPILFSAPMVRAILREIEEPGTGKTQTRRVLRSQPPEWANLCEQPSMLNALHKWVPSGLWRWAEIDETSTRALRQWPLDEEGSHYWMRLRIAVGDRLYVREAWRTESRAYDDLSPSAMGGEETIIFEADADWKLNKTVGRFRQGMHLPRWASRITLTVTDVRVQRLQEISEADAIAEGAPVCTVPGTIGHPLCQVGFNEMGTPVFWFLQLFNSINAQRGYGWDANSWVAAYTFRPILGNIDQVQR